MLDKVNKDVVVWLSQGLGAWLQFVKIASEKVFSFVTGKNL